MLPTTENTGRQRDHLLFYGRSVASCSISRSIHLLLQIAINYYLNESMFVYAEG
jgi:hypothetical protein